jgi:nucleoside 2-deoxyribosyltransferase
MKVFIIIPQYLDPTFDTKKAILIRSADKYEIKIFFGYNTGNENDINESINLLENADFVVADLSLARPSCYYEVGFAQSKNKQIYLMASIGTEIHQVKSKNEILFYKSLDEYEKLIDILLSKMVSSYNHLLLSAR